MAIKQRLQQKLVQFLTQCTLPTPAFVYRNRLDIDECEARTLADFKQPHILMVLLKHCSVNTLTEASIYNMSSTVRSHMSTLSDLNRITIQHLSETLTTEAASDLFTRFADYLHSNNSDETMWLPSYSVRIYNCKTTDIFENTCEHLRRFNVSYKELSREETISITTNPNIAIRGFYTNLPNTDSRVFVFVTKGLHKSALKPIKTLLYRYYTETMKRKYPEHYGKVWDNSLDTLYDNTFILNDRSVVVNRILENFSDILEELEKEIETQRKARIKAVLETLPNTALQRMAEEVSERRRRYDEQVVNLLRYEKEVIDAENRYYAIKHGEDSVNEAVKTLLNSLASKIKHISYRHREQRLYLVADNTLQFFDGSKLNTYLRNPRSTLSMAPVYIRNLLIEAFVKRTVKIHMTIGFSINIVSGDVSRVDLEDFPASELVDADRKGIPNTHHRYFNCWGDNRNTIIKAVRDGKLADAIMVAYAASAGINLSDTPVFSKLLDCLQGRAESFYRTLPYIEKDGVMLTIEEYRQLPEIDEKVMEV